MSLRYSLTDSAYRAARTAFEDAIKLADGQAKFAEICGCTQSNISQLLAKGSLLPSRYALKVEGRLGISREVLRPDVFALPPAQPVIASEHRPVACNHSPILPPEPAND